MNVEAIGEDLELLELKTWMIANGRCTLWDISDWENNNWEGWQKIEIHAHLEQALAKFMVSLVGKSPLSARKKDRRG